MLSAAAGAWSVQVEAFLHGGSQQPLPHDVLRRIFRKLQVVDARVDRRVAGVGGVHLRSNNQSERRPGHTLMKAPTRGADLPHDGEARVKVGQPTGGQRGAAGGELQEGFPLVRRHSTQNSDEAQEAGTGRATDDRSAPLWPQKLAFIRSKPLTIKQNTAVSRSGPGGEGLMGQTASSHRGRPVVSTCLWCNPALAQCS